MGRLSHDTQQHLDIFNRIIRRRAKDCAYAEAARSCAQTNQTGAKSKDTQTKQDKISNPTDFAPSKWKCISMSAVLLICNCFFNVFWSIPIYIFFMLGSRK